MRTVYKGAQGVRAMTVYDEILSHLRKCAALMSDPVIIRHEPSTVADAFVSAFHKIEQLQGLLPIQDEKTCGCPRPLDASIINSGIKQLVSLTLAKQLEPLRKPLPRIIAEDFKRFGIPAAARAEQVGDENHIEKEIKETNCIASMVLLYYYLQWHILLIVINKKYIAQEAEEVADIVGVSGKMPRALDLLEFKKFGNIFTMPPNGTSAAARDAAIVQLKASHSLQGIMTNNFFPNANDVPADTVYHDPGCWIDRKTDLVPLYRRVIETLTGLTEPAPAFHTTHSLHNLLQSVKIDYARKHVEQLGGVLSTFHLNDETQKWEDAYKKLQVEAKTDDNRLASFEFRLRDILTQPPYSVDRTAPDHTNHLQNAVPLSIYNYNNTPLMIDICKSAVQVKACIREISGDTAGVPYYFSSLLLQFIAVDPSLQGTLSSPDYQQIRFQHGRFEHYIADAPNSFRERNGVIALNGAGQIQHITIDHVPSYYVGSGPINLNNSNHIYLALPGVNVTVDDAPVIDRAQHLLGIGPIRQAGGTDDEKETYIKRFIRRNVCPLLRNSLVTAYGVKAIMALLERSKGIQQLTPTALYAYPGDQGGGVGTQTQLFQNRDDLPPVTRLSRADILDLLKKEQAAYQAYVTKFTSKSFKLMPGISWPVHYTVGTGAPTTNQALFTRLRYIPTRILGNTFEIVGRMDQLVAATNAIANRP